MQPVRLTLESGHRSDRSTQGPPSQACLRVYMCQADLPAACPAATNGLDGGLARLQDRGTGWMASLATPRSAGPAAPASVWAVTGGLRSPRSLEAEEKTVAASGRSHGKVTR